MHDKKSFETELKTEVHDYVTRFLREQYEPWHWKWLHKAKEAVLRGLSPEEPLKSIEKESLDDMLKNKGTSFSAALLALIDDSGMKPAEVYKKAYVDKRVFSKIRNGKNPSKETAVAFALALELDLSATRDLLGKAGYSLSDNNDFDTIIEYSITNGIYNISKVNEMLYEHGQKPIGCLL